MAENNEEQLPEDILSELEVQGQVIPGTDIPPEMESSLRVDETTAPTEQPAAAAITAQSADATGRDMSMEQYLQMQQIMAQHMQLQQEMSKRMHMSPDKAADYIRSVGAASPAVGGQGGMGGPGGPGGPGGMGGSATVNITDSNAATPMPNLAEVSSESIMTDYTSLGSINNLAVDTVNTDADTEITSTEGTVEPAVVPEPPAAPAALPAPAAPSAPAAPAAPAVPAAPAAPPVPPVPEPPAAPPAPAAPAAPTAPAAPPAPATRSGGGTFTPPVSVSPIPASGQANMPMPPSGATTAGQAATSSMNSTLQSNLADAGLIAGAQIAPQYFQPMLREKYPGMVTTTGSATRLGNLSRDLTQLQQNPGMTKAIAADQQVAGDVFSGMELTAKRLAGIEVTPEMEAAARERGAAIGQVAPAFLAAAPALGVPQEQVDSFRRAMYGEKGSVSELYSQGYSAFKPFMSTGEAAAQMDALTTGQYGSTFDKDRMSGLSADDMGASLRFLSKNGGMNKGMFEKGSGVGLSRMREDTLNAVRNGEPIEGIWDQQAVDTASTMFKEEAAAEGRDLSEELTGYLSEDENAAFSSAKTIDAEVGDLEQNTGYKVNIDTTIQDKDEALKKLNEQFDKNIADATEKGNEKAKEELEKSKEKLSKELEDFYSETEEKDENGKKLTKQEINSQREKRLSDAADRGMEDTVAGLQQELADMEMAKEEARSIEDPEERRAALEDIANWEDDLNARKEEDPMLKQASKVLDTTDVMDKAVATGKIGQSIQNAFASKGQAISTAEALEASKSLTGGTTYGKDMDKLGKEIAVTMQQMTENGRSMNSMLSSASSFDDVAKQLGIQGTARADMINMSGEQNWQSYTSNGMTDAEAREQIQKDKVAMAKTSKTTMGKNVMAMNGILQAASDEEIDKMMSGLDDEEQAILMKMKNHEELSPEEMKKAGRLSKKALKAAGYDSREANEMLRDKDNIDRGADDWAVRQMESYNNEKQFKKMGSGLDKVLGDSVNDSENRKVIQDVMAANAVKFHEAAVVAGPESTEKRIDALNEFAMQLDREGQSDAAKEIYDAIKSGDESKINAKFTGLNKRMEKAGDRRVTASKVDQKQNKRAEHENAEAINALDEQLGTAKKGGLTGVLDAIKSGKSISDVKELYTAATGYDEIQEEDKQLIANSMVLNGNVKSGKFTNAEGIEDTITADEINIAKQGASRMDRWNNMTEGEALETMSGIKTKGGKELTVAEAREITQKSFEAANSQLPGGADMSAREGGFTDYVTPEERMMQDDEQMAAFEERAQVRAMKAADKLERQGRSDEADKIREDAMAGGDIVKIAEGAEESTRSKGWESTFSSTNVATEDTLRAKNREDISDVESKIASLSEEDKKKLEESNVLNDFNEVSMMSKAIDADKGTDVSTILSDAEAGMNEEDQAKGLDSGLMFGASPKSTKYGSQEMTTRDKKSMDKEIHEVLKDIKRILEQVSQ